MNFDYFFFDAKDQEAGTHKGFECRIRSGIQTPEELFESLAEELLFPDYFGQNWDALLDLLRDLSWIPQRVISIVHDDIPLVAHAGFIRKYCEILNQAVMDWRVTDTSTVPAPEHWPYVEHILEVRFPARYKDLLEKTLA